MVPRSLADVGAAVVLVALVGGSLPVVAGRSGPAGLAGASWSDFNADGYDDLAIGAPGETIGGKAKAGAVHVIYGRASGLAGGRSQVFHQDRPNLAGAFAPAEAGDRFGAAIAPGDFNGDGYGDLAIGIPGEEDGSPSTNDVDGGAVLTLFGSINGLTGLDETTESAYDTFSSSPGGTPGWAFGAALLGVESFNQATGLAGADQYTDVVIGIPGAYGGMGFAYLRAGDPNVPSGNALGLGPTTALPGDRCGSALAAGDFDGTTAMDIAIGCPRYNADLASEVPDAGRVVVVYDLDAEDAQSLIQNSLPGGDAEPGDRFGSALAAGDLEERGQDQLLIGVPDEDGGGLPNTGVVHLVRSNGARLDRDLGIAISLATAGVPGVARAGDRFGAALLVADFGGPGATTMSAGTRPRGFVPVRELDLAVGLPGRDVSGRDRAGAVIALYWTGGTMLSTGNQTWHQDLTGVQDAAEPVDHFGAALAAGLWRDGVQHSLAIGIPGEGTASATDAGAVAIIHGTPGTLKAAGNLLLRQGSGGVRDISEDGDRFGAALGARLE